MHSCNSCRRFCNIASVLNCWEFLVLGQIVWGSILHVNSGRRIGGKVPTLGQLRKNSDVPMFGFSPGKSSTAICGADLTWTYMIRLNAMGINSSMIHFVGKLITACLTCLELELPPVCFSNNPRTDVSVFLRESGENFGL